MGEIWKRIDEYPEYEVSTYGNVRSVDRDIVDTWGRKYHLEGKPIKLQIQITDNDYKQVIVSIWSNRKPYRLIVARLVAKAFIPNPNNYPQVNHKDEDSTNNHVDNLEWCTSKYNINYGNYLQRRSKSKNRAVDVFDINNNYIETLSSEKEASEKYKISRGDISAVCHGNRRSAKKYIFRFH